MTRKQQRHSKSRHRSKRQRKIKVNAKFYKAVHTLKRMKGKQRRQTMQKASNAFIRDFSSAMRQVRKLPPDLLHINPHLQRKLWLQRKGLREFASSKTSLGRKRKMMKGGILPALIPIICAGIAASGGVASAAVGAAIAKS